MGLEVEEATVNVDQDFDGYINTILDHRTLTWNQKSLMKLEVGEPTDNVDQDFDVYINTIHLRKPSMGRDNYSKRLKQSLPKSLPSDILFDILARVPAEDLIPLKRVCKQWYNIIITREFSKAHLKHCESRVGIIIPYYINRNIYDYIYDYKSIDIRTMECHELDLRPYIKKNVTVLDSLDGLILFDAASRSRNKIYVCNPLTERLKLLLCVPLRWNSTDAYYKLVFDPVLKKYKVVGFCYKGPDRCIDSSYCALTLNGDEEGKWPVYRDLRTPVWRKVETQFLHRLQCEFVPVRCAGVLYWIAYTVDKDIEASVSFIQSMDIVKEEFKERIPLPCQVAEPRMIAWGNFRLLPMENMKGSLSVVIPESHDELGIWVLKDWDKHVWVKQLKLCIDSMLGNLPRLRSFVLNAFSILFVMDAHDLNLIKFIVGNCRGLCFYSLKDRELTEISCCPSFSSFTYVPSLVCWA